LRSTHDIRDWNNLLHSNIWETQSKIIPTLRISYQHLPPYLKRCFVYCSLFPKDHEFYREELILLWMAEDLLQPPKNGKTLEEVGYDHFNDSVSRSFFQRSWSGSRCFVMHDLVHDLATFTSGEFYFQSEDLGRETEIIGAKTRHLSFAEFTDPAVENFEFFGRPKFLRTFFPIIYNDYFYNENMARIILLNLKYSRVLSFNCFTLLHTLPDSIGELIHMRYLDLSSSGIETLPDSLCNLYNLQTLKLCYCERLTKLPNDMQNLVNLRHFDFKETYLEELPREMSRLNHLQHLSYFVVGKHEDKGTKELGTLSNLHGSLSIRKLENVTNSFEASEAKMMDKKYLEQLSLEWSPVADFSDSQSEMNILSKLQPYKNLERLYLSNYRGTKFPKWVGDPSYHNITQLSLSRCENCFVLPPLGQLRSLKNMTICGMNMLRTIESEFYKNGDSISETPFPWSV